MGFLFSTSLPTFVSWLVHFSHSGWCEGVSHCGFDLNFPDAKWCGAFFHVSVGQLTLNSWVHNSLIFYVTNWEVYIKYFCHMPKCRLVSNKTTCAIGWISPATFFLMKQDFYLREWLTVLWQLLKRGYTGRHFIENEWREPVASSKTDDSIYCQWNNLSFQVKIRILKNLYIPRWA